MTRHAVADDQKSDDGEMQQDVSNRTLQHDTAAACPRLAPGVLRSP
jgi:hypothetical protein